MFYRKEPGSGQSWKENSRAAGWIRIKTKRETGGAGWKGAHSSLHLSILSLCVFGQSVQCFPVVLTYFCPMLGTIHYLQPRGIPTAFSLSVSLLLPGQLPGALKNILSWLKFNLSISHDKSLPAVFKFRFFL